MPRRPPAFSVALVCCATVLTAPEIVLGAGLDAPSRRAFEAWAAERVERCAGAPGVLSAPIDFAVGGRSYRLEGHQLRQLGKARPSSVKIGVFSTLKDARPETQQALEHLLDWMRRQRVDLVVANGDLGASREELESNFGILAKLEVPVVALAGNADPCAAFNQVAASLFANKPNILNGNWVRRFDLLGATLLTLPGYFETAFTDRESPALYSEEDVALTGKIAEGAVQPIVLVSHGPPRMPGRYGIDLARGGAHLGDPAMAALLATKRIRFGVFGHVLESGGRATDRRGRRPLRPGRWAKELLVNAGSIHPEPWSLLDGSRSRGVGAILELRGGSGRYLLFSP